MCSALELAKVCTGFDCHRVEFLHNTLYVTVFWICADTSVINH